MSRRFADPAHEVKWIWKEPFENGLPCPADRLHAASYLANSQLPVLCNHCANPPCVRVCPTQATWKRGRRHRDDGLAPLHRLPVLHGRLPVRLAQLQLVGSRGRTSQPMNPEFPTRTKGVVEKCNFCEERLAEGQLPGVRGGLPGEGAGLRRSERPEFGGAASCLRARYAVQRKPELGTGPSVLSILV